MHLSTFLFYCANVVLVVAYLVIAALTHLPGGVRGKGPPMSPLMRRLTIGFFMAGAGLHADMAVHTLFHRPFFTDSGGVDWDITAAVCVQTVAVFTSLVLIRREKRRQGSDPS